MRLNPDRIIIGEVRGREALDLLKAWNTGHPGGCTTVHANNAIAALQRLDQLAQGGGGAESLYERERREKSEDRARIEADPFVLEVKRVFPGAQLMDVRTLTDQTAEPAAGTTGEADDADED